MAATDHSRPHHGPHVILTPTEIERVRRALENDQDEEALAIKKKIEVSQGSDPRLRQPSS